MSLGVDFENVQISEFETILDETLPKLFKKINYYINTDYMQAPQNITYDASQNLNITQIINRQQSIFKNLDDSNYYLSQNLEETTDLVDRVTLHKEIATHSLDSIVKFMENWMKKSNEELYNMENDLLNAETTLKKFNLDEIVSKTQKKIDNLNDKITKNSENFDKYAELSNKMRSNKDTIKKTLKGLKGFKGKLKKYLNKTSKRDGKNSKIFYFTLKI